MFDSFVALFPTEWQGAMAALVAPIAWIPGWTGGMVNVVATQNIAVSAVMIVALAMPALLLVAGTWSTMLSLYTLPFRSGRGHFVTAMLMMWWDAGRVVWLYWTGFARLAVALAGWFF